MDLIKLDMQAPSGSIDEISRKAIANFAPSSNGVYVFENENEILYVGKSINIKARLLSHLENSKVDAKEERIILNSTKIKWYVTDSEFKALILESSLIQKHKPRYNSRWKDDKSYLYIKITIKDEYPKVFAVRSENDRKSLYYGPFSSLREIEAILKHIRRIFPFCTQKKIGRSACFYSKINLCKPCPSYTSHLKDEDLKRSLKKIYRKNVTKVAKILDGKIDSILKELYRELKSLSTEENYEEAIKIRDKIKRFQRLLEGRIIEDEIYDNYDTSTAAIEDLKKILNAYAMAVESLRRIECFDISNTSMKEATASMVVFIDGQVEKSEYRKFKLRRKSSRSDFEMMREAFERRLKQSWDKPDLIVVDGGKPQLRAVLSVLEKSELKNSVIGIAKNPDRIILGKEGMTTLRLSKNNKGFNLIRAVRDESHRFAKKYHLYLRGNRQTYS